MPGIKVRDAVRDRALNTRFKTVFGGKDMPSCVILSCSKSFADLIATHGSLYDAPAAAVYHAINQSWAGIGDFYDNPEPKPTFALVHMHGVIEFVVQCGPWVKVHDKRIIFAVSPLSFRHPLHRLLGEDISKELWKDQGLGSLHSALLLNY